MTKIRLLLAALMSAMVLAFAPTAPAHAVQTITIQGENFQFANVVNDNGTTVVRVDSNTGSVPRTFGFDPVIEANRQAGTPVQVCFRWRTNNINGTGGVTGSLIGGTVSGVQSTYTTTCKSANVRSIDLDSLVELTSGSYSSTNRRMFFDWVSVTG